MAEREEDTWQVEGLSVESDSEEEPEERPEEEADAAEEAQLPRQEEMDLAPSKVFFTHDHISSKFRSGTLIDDAVRDIINGGQTGQTRREASRKEVLLWQKTAEVKKGDDPDPRKRAQQAKWKLQQSVPSDILNQLGKTYGILWEIITHPRSPQAAVKLTPDLNCTKFPEGVQAMREVVARRYSMKSQKTGSETKTVLSVQSPLEMSAQEKRAAEKKKSIDKKTVTSTDAGSRQQIISFMSRKALRFCDCKAVFSRKPCPPMGGKEAAVTMAAVEEETFSNFFELRKPYEFVLPRFAQREGFPKSFECWFSEATFRCATANFKLRYVKTGETFDKILKAQRPGQAKALGRQDLHENDPHAVSAGSDPRLATVLLKTGNAVIVEAAPDDRIWSVGLDRSDPRVYDPKQWLGRNILGFALMKARDALKSPAVPTGEASEEAPAESKTRWGSKKGEAVTGPPKPATLPAKKQEIIEFPLVLVDAQTLERVDEFRTYVRPERAGADNRNPKLTEFCTELTGILQEQVDAAPVWTEALKQARNWLQKRSYGRLDEGLGSTVHRLESPRWIVPIVSFVVPFWGYFPGMAGMLTELEMTLEGCGHLVVITAAWTIVDARLLRPGLVSTALSARSRSSSPQALMPDGSQSARGIPTFASKPWSPAVPHDRAVVASVPFPAYRTAASAAVPAARQHTSPIRYQQPFTPIVARPYQMASAPAVPMPPVQFRPPAQTLQESPEVDSEYSPRDSVWKRYFCNPTKAQTGGSSLPPAMPPKILPMEKERAPSQPAEAASLRSQRPETGSTPQGHTVMPSPFCKVSAGSLPEAPDDRLDLRAQSQLLPPDSPLPGSTPTPEAKVSAAAPADTPQSMVSESPSLTKRRPCVGVTSQAPSRLSKLGFCTVVHDFMCRLFLTMAPRKLAGAAAPGVDEAAAEMNPESDGDEEEKEALLGSASSLELTERRPSESVAEGPVQHHLFAMSLREARSLVEDQIEKDDTIALRIDVLRSFTDRRADELANILESARVPGHPYFTDGWHLSDQGMRALCSTQLADMAEDFDLVISDSTLCVVEKAKQHKGGDGGRLVHSLVSAPVHPAWGRGFYRSGFCRHLWDVMEAPGKVLLVVAGNDCLIMNDWCTPEDLQHEMEYMRQAYEEEGVQLHILDVVLLKPSPGRQLGEVNMSSISQAIRQAAWQDAAIVLSDSTLCTVVVDKDGSQGEWTHWRYRVKNDGIHYQEPPIEEEPRRAEEPGKLVLDPCLGRGEVLCAKARLGLVLIAGVFLILGLGRLGHNWLEMRIAQGAVPPIEAAIVIGVLMPAILISFLCLLEHCEWHYVRTLFPTGALPYTPLLHGCLARLRFVGLFLQRNWVTTTPSAGTPEIHERSVATSATSAADPLVAAASGVVVEDLTELASMPRPHPAVQRVAECVLMLLGFRDSSWAAARSAFESADIFQERLQAFRAPRSLSRLQFQKLQRSLEAAKAAWSDPAVANRCRACLGLEQWCRAVAEALAPKFEALANSSRKISTLGASTGSSSVNGTTSLPGTSRGRDVPEAAARTSIPIGLGDLIITPNIYALQPHELRRVRDLTICRPKVGEVTFHGDLDLVTESNILEDLPHVLRLEPGEVVLYPDSRTKPREGKGLNRPATITLFRCLPPSGAAFPDEESKVRYRNRIAQMTEAKGARFVDYDCDQGLWQFRVDHF
ncbi:3'-5' exonuclease eri-1 [Symbiodinium microadriaticum]|uniref:3'-5' exonuclease eri-1 n=2 Tax=Symbiodinium TaxID=2949 RepID=A0A1Q9DGB9_SYMMI|nr:3'-5' exonuclease eri-1 [Symbiodinium microadriaticum]